MISRWVRRAQALGSARRRPLLPTVRIRMQACKLPAGEGQELRACKPCCSSGGKQAARASIKRSARLHRRPRASVFCHRALACVAGQRHPDPGAEGAAWRPNCGGLKSLSLCRPDWAPGTVIISIAQRRLQQLPQARQRPSLSFLLGSAAWADAYTDHGTPLCIVAATGR